MRSSGARRTVALAAVCLLLLIGALLLRVAPAGQGAQGRVTPPPTFTATATRIAPPATAPLAATATAMPVAPTATANLPAVATAPPVAATATAIPAVPTATANLPAVATITALTVAPAGTANLPARGLAPPSPAPLTPTSGPATATPLPVETPDPGAWLSRSTAHYDLFYLPDSPAARDIALLAQSAEDAMTWAAAHLQAPPNTRIRIYFVNRIFWQGGASYSHNELLLSYPAPDREYTSTSLALVLRHETTHALVEQMLGSDAHKGGLLGEGVAVWDAGGHYQTEPLAVLAGTLITDNVQLYLPLADLRHDFYGAQHEIAYLEGGAYVQFLIARYGLPRFKRYLDQPDNPLPIYGLDSAALESAWRTWLAATPHTAADSAAVRLRVRYYDLMRRYETTLDPNARLLPGPPPSQWGPTLIGLFSRPAAASLNVALEHDFVRAGAALWSRDLAGCTRLLDSLDARIPH